MLTANKATRAGSSLSGAKSNNSVDLERLIAIARRQWRLVTIFVIASLALGTLYVVTAVPQYTATANVLIDRGNREIASQLSTVASTDLSDDDASILSQVEVIKSDNIATIVIDRLHLIDDPVFLASTSPGLDFTKGLFDIKSWFPGNNLIANQDDRKKRQAVNIFDNNLSVLRINKTYAIAINYTSTSPQLAADVANTVADAYLYDKLNARYDSTREAATWLQQRIDELKQQAIDSDYAIQKFRADNGLISTGTSLVSDQQLSRTNTELINAQTDVARAQAKYDRLEQILTSKDTAALVSDVLDSATIVDLQKKYLAASKKESEISDRLGPNHEQAVRLRAEMDEYQRLMFEELGRIGEGYKSDLDVAKSRVQSLSENVAAATGVAVLAGETQVHLRELERRADATRSLYQNFLARYQAATQEQTFPIGDARIITTATWPKKPSFPRKALTLAVAGFFGLVVGSGFGAFREMRNQFIRTGDQVRDMLDLEYLGIAPIITAVADGAQESGISPAAGAASYVVKHPLSAFAETLRSAKIAVDLRSDERSSKIIGIASSLAGEGKSTIALNFAKLLSMQGATTLLIDGDFRNPGATRLVGHQNQIGLLDVLLERTTIQNALLVDSTTKLSFLPATIGQRVPHSAELLSSLSMRKLLDDASGSFDYVVVDLPPLGPVVDARAIGPLLDFLVYVVEWGRTSHHIIRSTLLAEPELVHKCVGVILNKVDTEKMKLYRAYGSSEYYYSRYTSYYHDA